MKKLLLLFLLIPALSWGVDTEVQDLTDITSPAVGDDMYIVDNPDVTPISRKINIGALLGVSPDMDTSGQVTIAAADISDQNAGTDITADLEEEVTEGSLADQTIITDDIKEGTILYGDISLDAAVVDGDYVTLSTTGTNFNPLSAAEVLSNIGAESATSNDIDPDRLAGDTVDDNAIDDAIIPNDITITESDPNALLTAGTDNVKDTHIDWGSGAFGGTKCSRWGTRKMALTIHLYANPLPNTSSDKSCVVGAKMNGTLAWFQLLSERFLFLFSIPFLAAPSPLP